MSDPELSRWHDEQTALAALGALLERITGRMEERDLFEIEAFDGVWVAALTPYNGPAVVTDAAPSPTDALQSLADQLDAGDQR